MNGALGHDLLGLAFGLLVGTSLGLTGGGGSIFAVPLLIYGLSVPLDTAIGLSLAAVGITAGFGAAWRLRAGEVELQAGLIFSLAGMVVTPAGAWLAGRVAPAILLSAFSMLMLYVGVRMWRGKAVRTVVPGPCVSRGFGWLGPGCYLRLAAAGAATGMLSGLFGVGGGFIIVPSLLYVTGMSIHRAVSTSLMVIFLVSLSGVASHALQGQRFPMPLSALFVVGGFLGMLGGGSLRGQLSGPTLQRTFGIGMWLVAAYILGKNISAFLPG